MTFIYLFIGAASDAVEKYVQIISLGNEYYFDPFGVETLAPLITERLIDVTLVVFSDKELPSIFGTMPKGVLKEPS